MICHQRKIREELALAEPRATMESLIGCEVRQISKDAAQEVILKYEWLGTMPSVGLAYYGLFTEQDEIVGVSCFGVGGGSLARNVCGEEFRDKVICLERGACVHWAHPHAGSFLVAKACKLASRDYGWKAFYAYSDEEAGEIGTIYQACNWIYLGRGVGRGNGNTGRAVFFDPSGKKISSRSLRNRLKVGETIKDVWPSLSAAGWTRKVEPDKHKYLLVLSKGKEREKMLSVVVSLPYPKRGAK